MLALLIERGSGAEKNAAEPDHLQKLKSELTHLQQQLHAPTPELTAEQTLWEAELKREVTWQPLTVASLEASGKPLWEKQPDGSILVRSGVPAKGTYTVHGTSSMQRITGLRLEALPDDSLPNRGPGHAPSGNAVVSEIRLGARPTKLVAPTARFVRVEAPGKGRFLHLAEVQVMSKGENVALKGKASQISTDFGGEAARGIDGNTDGIYTANSTTHTAPTDHPWWEVDLGREFPLDQIVVWNRMDGDTKTRLSPYKVSALNEEYHEVWQQSAQEAPNPSAAFAVSNTRASVDLKNANATYSQEGWEVAKAIDGDEKTGWAFGPRSGELHTAIFCLKEPLDFGGAGEVQLDLQLVQTFGDDHTLGRFRVSVTQSPQPLLALSAGKRAILAKPPEARSEAEAKLIRELFLPVSAVHRKTRELLALKQKEINEIEPIPVPVIQDLPKAPPHSTQLLNKGNSPEVGQSDPAQLEPKLQ
jgi:hypothetical protein